MSAWVFGYGSLLWNVGFPYDERCTGYIKGYARRFWQGSPDHSGTPEKPGRVVTLVRDVDDSNTEDLLVWGVAYLLPTNETEKILSQLDYRERCGYVQTEQTFYPADKTKESFSVLAYVSQPDNPHFLGPAPLDEMARQIATAQGMTRRNFEYLFKLAEAMRDLAPSAPDDHLYALESKVKEVLNELQTARTI